MIAYIETKVTRIFGDIPCCKPEHWFASDTSDAIASRRFDESITTYEEIDCCDAMDADQEVKRRRQKLIDQYSDKRVWFDVKQITQEDYEFWSTKEDAFEKKYST